MGDLGYYEAAEAAEVETAVAAEAAETAETAEYACVDADVGARSQVGAQEGGGHHSSRTPGPTGNQQQLCQTWIRVASCEHG